MKRAKPSFDAAPRGGAERSTGWVYRSDTVVPAVRRVPSPASSRPSPHPASAPDGFVITALDLISWPFAFVAIAALAPFQWLIGSKPSSR